MIEISGLDKLQRQLNEATKAIEKLSNESIEAKFDPSDPVSIEAAIQQTNNLIDERIANHASNPFVAPLVEQVKEASRKAILERAANARLQKDAE